MSDLIKLYEQQEEKLQFTSFGSDEAWTLGCIMAEILRKNSYPVAVDINLAGQEMFHYANTGATVDLEEWLMRKRNTVMYAKTSSILFGTKLKESGKTFADLGLDAKDYVDCGGGFPIIVKGKGVVGAITVSGLIDTMDHQIMIDSISAFLKL